MDEESELELLEDGKGMMEIEEIERRSSEKNSKNALSGSRKFASKQSS
jgi:hypothetical protein